MKRRKDMYRMKEQDKTPEKQLIEVEIDKSKEKHAKTHINQTIKN